MPYVRGDFEVLEEMGVQGEDLPDGFGEEFVYEWAEAAFEPDRLGTMARLTLDALKELGATVFGVKYDGGFDEGFAHPDYVVIAGTRKSADAAAGAIATPQWLAKVRTAIEANNRLAIYKQLTDAKLAGEAI